MERRGFKINWLPYNLSDEEFEEKQKAKLLEIQKENLQEQIELYFENEEISNEKTKEYTQNIS